MVGGVALLQALNQQHNQELGITSLSGVKVPMPGNSRFQLRAIIKLRLLA